MEGLILIAVVGVAAFFIWRNKDKLKAKFDKLRGKVEDKIDDLRD